MTEPVRIERYSVSAASTPYNDVFEDIRQSAASGATGHGLMENKLPDGQDDRIRREFDLHGLRPTYFVPRVWTILPVAFSRHPQPQDPSERVEAICASIPRLAQFGPAAIVVGPGTSGDPDRPVGPLSAVEDGMVRIADVAARHGVPVGFEVLAARRGSPVPTIDSALDLIDTLDASNVGLFLDVFHSWDEPDLHPTLARVAPRVTGVQVNDLQWEERSGFDRLYPGDGRATAASFMAALERGGYQGWYELEILSDDGSRGTDLPDSLWKKPHAQMLEEAAAAFRLAWTECQLLLGNSSQETP